MFGTCTGPTRSARPHHVHIRRCPRRHRGRPSIARYENRALGNTPQRRFRSAATRVPSTHWPWHIPADRSARAKPGESLFPSVKPPLRPLADDRAMSASTGFPVAIVCYRLALYLMTVRHPSSVLRLFEYQLSRGPASVVGPWSSFQHFSFQHFSVSAFQDIHPLNLIQSSRR